MGYTLRRILILAIKEAAVFYAATAGERLAKRHIKLPTTKRRTTRNKRKNRK